MAISSFYCLRGTETVGNFCVQALGIHETMAPGVVRHGGAWYPFLFMFFHSPAWLKPGMPERQAGAGGVVIWEPGAPHDYGNPEGEWDHSWMIVRGDAVAREVARHQLPLNQLLFLDAERIFVGYLAMVYDELRRQPQQDSYMLEGLVALWLHELARLRRHDEARAPENILAAEEFMRRNFSKPLTLQEIARSASLSAPRFLTLFKQFHGEPPIHFLIRVRMEYAAQLLRYKHLPIKQIAHDTGFADPLYFSRQFTAFFGASPRAWRERL